MLHLENWRCAQAVRKLWSKGERSLTAFWQQIWVFPEAFSECIVAAAAAAVDAYIYKFHAINAINPSLYVLLKTLTQTPTETKKKKENIKHKIELQ